MAPEPDQWTFMATMGAPIVAGLSALEQRGKCSLQLDICTVVFVPNTIHKYKNYAQPIVSHFVLKKIDQHRNIWRQSYLCNCGAGCGAGGTCVYCSSCRFFFYLSTPAGLTAQSA